MRTNVSKPVVDSVPPEGIDAVGVERTVSTVPTQGGKPERKRWYIAIVNNKTEKLCVDRLEKRVASQPEGEKDYEVYVASQKGDEPHCYRQAEVGGTNPVPLHSFHPLYRYLT